MIKGLLMNLCLDMLMEGDGNCTEKRSDEGG